MRTLYESGLTNDRVCQKIEEFLPNIQQFIQNYIKKNQTTNKHIKEGNWCGTVKAVEDIEENIWSPELGLKGKVDVTVKTDVDTLPLEVKTGRPSFSLEHRGQVIMYVMMMQKLGYKVSSGLLLYIRYEISVFLLITKTRGQGNRNIWVWMTTYW